MGLRCVHGLANGKVHQDREQIVIESNGSVAVDSLEKRSLQSGALLAPAQPGVIQRNSIPGPVPLIRTLASAVVHPGFEV